MASHISTCLQCADVAAPHSHTTREQRAGPGQVHGNVGAPRLTKRHSTGAAWILRSSGWHVTALDDRLQHGLRACITEAESVCLMRCALCGLLQGPCTAACTRVEDSSASTAVVGSESALVPYPEPSRHPQ
jgi:hypothetical protein